jgi:exodeoxyribonuclease VII small subunit
MTKKNKSKDIIDQKLLILEKLVKKFEGGKINIEEGVSEYKKAAQLIQDIKKELSSLELKIEEIKGTYE